MMLGVWPGSTWIWLILAIWCKYWSWGAVFRWEPVVAQHETCQHPVVFGILRTWPVVKGVPSPSAMGVYGLYHVCSKHKFPPILGAFPGWGTLAKCLNHSSSLGSPTSLPAHGVMPAAYNRWTASACLCIGTKHQHISRVYY